MNRTILVFIIILFINQMLCAQSADQIILTDSSKTEYQQESPDLNFLINKAEFLRYTTLQGITELNADNSKLWLQSKVTLDKNFFSFENNDQPYEDLLSPLMQQYQSQQKMKPLYYILGTAQTAAVGYLAYKHIKKYGFK
ncbi:MAG: hypothetical protein IPM56_18375 [Ignavibacteriales bacterium]|nr:MAG: hypothetical protein IPM56_18375 [Ignavibacteriales bacterium]